MESDINQRVVLSGEQKGLKIPRMFTKDGEDAYQAVEWEKRTSLIKNPDGTIVFKMDNVEIPKFWSQTAADILAQKYLRKRGVPQVDASGNPILDAHGRQLTGSETSLKQVVHRLAGCWTWWGNKFNYFATQEDAKAFYDEIAFMLLRQFCAPNSPQWFNTGLHWAYGITGPAQGHWYVDPDTKQLVQSQDAYSHSQCHACFIQPVRDELVNEGGILDLAVREARIFKYGSGCTSGESYIYTDKFGLMKINELFEKFKHIGIKDFDRKGKFVNVSKLGIHTISMTNDGIFEKDLIEKVWQYDVSKEDKLKVSLSNGTRVVVSAWHPFLVWNGRKIEERRADQLNRGDAVLSSNSTIKRILPEENVSIEWTSKYFKEEEKNTVKVDKDLSWLIGYFIGDGSLGKRKQKVKGKLYEGLRLRFFDETLLSLEKAKVIIKEKFGDYSKISYDKRSKCLVLYCLGRRTTSFFSNITKPNKTYSIEFPEFILKSQLTNIYSFLAGLIDSDGHVTAEGKTAYSTASRLLAEKLSVLSSLLGFGGGMVKDDKTYIVTLIAKSTNSSKLMKVLENMSNPGRKERLSESLLRENHRKRFTIPLSEEIFGQAFDIPSKTSNWLSYSVGTSTFHLGRLKYEGVINPVKLKRLLFEVDTTDATEFLKRISESATFVESIETTDENPEFFDLTVNKNNNYLAGQHGLVVIHNTGTNFSNLRAKGEPLSGGGTSSGVMSFLKINDVVAGSIKCVHEDTELVTKNGIKKIKNVKKGEYVLTKNGFKKVSNVFDNGVKNLVKIRTSLGFEVLCTPEHRFLVRTSDGEEVWKEVKDITQDDFINIDFSGYEYNDFKKLKPVGLNHHNERKIKLPEILDEKFAEWLGLIYGDGSVTETRHASYVGIQIGLDDKDMSEKYKKLSKELFGIHVYENKRKDKHDNSISLRIASKPLIRFLRENDCLKTSSTKLSIPLLIKESPSSVRAAFLRGLFESDGTIERRMYPSCSSVSERMVKDIQSLLQSIGILSKSSHSDNRSGAYGILPIHRVLVTSFFGIKEFAAKVSFLSDRKRQTMLEGLKCLENRDFEQQWILPYFENDFEEMYAGLPGGKYDVRRAASQHFRESTGKTNFNRFRANKLLNKFVQLKGSFIEPLSRSNVYYDKITVEPFGDGHVFDLEIPDGNQYLITGIVSHNSGGTTRRAAKMVLLNIDHPEIEAFIKWKANEEKKFAALVGAGLVKADSIESAGEHVFGQNSNNSVRVTDDFMKAVIEDKDWNLTWRTDGGIAKTVKAKYLWDAIAQSAWECADPGLQFDTTYNDWHTCPASGRINATNPCSEYAFLDNTACNLASLNLGKFMENGTFDVEGFKHAARLWTIVLEISVLMAQYPSKEIAQLSYEYRTLGLGYTNLGSILMKLGIPYDSEKARAIAAALTAIMTGESYAASAEMASVLEPFPGFEKNKEHMLRVVRNHRRAAYNAPKEEYEGLHVIPPGIDHTECPDYMLKAAIASWDKALMLGERYGYRNAQATLIAPTGTISFVMDADTTGIEPDFALVKFKKLVGGGYFKIVNQTVEPALKNLGYTKEEIREILRYMVGSNTFEGSPYINAFTLKRKGFSDADLEKTEKLLHGVLDLSFVFNISTLGKECIERLGFKQAQYNEPDFDLLRALGFRDDEIEAANEFICGTQTIEGAPHLKAEHYPIFDCANKCGKKGERYINYMAHVYMMAATQPFLSGSISKTINMPNHATVEEIEKVYFESWKLGLKSLALYRDGSKMLQPLSVFKQQKQETAAPVRKKLQQERKALAHKFRIGNQEGYIHVGLFEDGHPGELFVTMAKQGSTLSGLMDAFALTVSIGLQYGVPLKVLVSKFINSRFEPMGWTDNEEIPVAKSIMDYIFRWMAFKFLARDDLKELGLLNGEKIIVSGEEVEGVESQNQNVARLTQFVHEREEHKYDMSGDASTCSECGSLMVRSGSCYVCTSCGSTSGCS